MNIVKRVKVKHVDLNRYNVNIKNKYRLKFTQYVPT